MKINGVDISTLGLQELSGTLESLLKPCSAKKIVTNGNSSLNGVVAFVLDRKVDKRDVTLSFYLKANNLANMHTQLEYIEKFLLLGDQRTGINVVEFTGISSKFHLVYENASKFNTFGDSGRCVVSFKFTEPNPRNR